MQISHGIKYFAVPLQKAEKGEKTVVSGVFTVLRIILEFTQVK